MASGNALAYWDALGNQPVDADFATLDTILTTSADEPDDVVPILDFDPGSTQEYVALAAFMPDHYDGGGLTLTLVWTANVTTGNVKWDAQLKRQNAGANLLSKTYAAEQTVTDAAPATARNLEYAVITFTNSEIDGILKNEYFRLQITRDSADAGDTMNSNDAELIAVYLTET